jgi:dolichol-phosphate mannosyltransferase
MGDRARFFPVMVRWTGFRRTSIPVQHDARGNGGSSYTLKKLLKLALDIMLSYSDKPLRLVATAGIVISIIALAMTAFSLYRYLHGDVTVAGYTSVIGLYVGRVFESVKSRPHFIVREKLNL